MMEKLRDNLASLIVATIFAAAAGWFLGTSQMAQVASDVTEIRKVAAELKADSKAHFAFDNCTDKRLYAIENGIKKPPPCAGTGDDK